MVKDDWRRSMLFDLDMAVIQVNQQLPAQPDGAAPPVATRLTGVYHNLLRRWAEP